MSNQRELMARQERRLYLMHALAQLQQDLAASILDEKDGGKPFISRAYGRVQYLCELMGVEGDWDAPITVQGMYDYAQSFSGIAKYQPMSSMKKILDRFEHIQNSTPEAEPNE